MEFKDIVTISGKSGLFKVLKPTRTGFVLEALDDSAKKMVTNPRQKVSVLEEISIYTNDSEGSIPLKDVMGKIYKEFKGHPGVDSTSSPGELRSFLKHIVPGYDEQRVYNSDIKKLVSWYQLLLEKSPEVFESPKKSKDKKNEEKPEKPSKAAGKKKKSD